MSPACDVGTIYNQTTPEGIPASNARGGRTAFNGKYNTESLSWLQGQRLSACTCAGEDHPGPKLSDGSFKGRGAVEIDVFEAQVGKGKADPSIRTMQVSQSAQDQYTFANTTGPAYDLFTPLSSEANTYKGAAYQQSGSIVSDTLAGSTEKGAFGIGGGGGFATYGTEYTTGAQGSATWINNGNPSFRINPAALEPDPVSQISNRVMASEPMDYPTQDYINRHPEAYSNAQLQFWGEGASGEFEERSPLDL
ncbi:hypothetical protein L7F22_003855 [Adiantum nelumboides]|nr:hypothetical protein [Adiantum nelumboides]